MMSASSATVLGDRLERLTGTEAACCVSEYRELASEVRSTARFRATLERAGALADSSRLLALALLRRRGELCACELQAALDVTHATVSHHMHLLEEAGLVSVERRGKWMYYRLRDRAEVRIP